MLSILYGLLAAVGWGSSDFVGGLASRRVGAYQAVLFTEGVGLFVLLPAAFIFGEPVISWQELAWCATAGALGVTGLGLLFQAFKDGQMSLVAPVSAVTAAVLPIVVGFFTVGAPKPAQLGGFALALAAVWLISYQPQKEGKMQLRLADLVLPLLAGAGFGLYFILFNKGSQNAVIWPMVAGRSAGIVALGSLTLLQGQRLLPSGGAWGLLALNFALDLGATVMYILAGQAGRMDIAAVLTSLYPGLTILLAWLILKERINRPQQAGIILALAAIALIAI